MEDEDEIFEGRFLVRARKNNADDYVLSVIYRNKPTHHLLTRDTSGNILVCSLHLNFS